MLLDQLETLARSSLRPEQRVLLDIVRENARAIQCVLKDEYGDQPQPTPASGSLAQQVFAVPELLESILLCLGPRHLLVAMRISKTFLRLTTSSMKILRRLHLHESENASWSTLFSSSSYDFAGLTCDLSSMALITPEQDDCTRWAVEVHFHRKLDSRRFGSRCRTMLCCEPLIKAVSVYTSCCAPYDDYTSVPLEVVKVDTGLTVGDVIDVTTRLREAHRLCPEADFGRLDDNGFYTPFVSFRATVILRDDDPMVVRERESPALVAREEEEQEAWESRMELYTDAKQQVSVNNPMA